MANSNIETLNDLVQINNDRIEGYEKAIKHTDNLDVDLKAVFQTMIAESKEYKNELSSLIAKQGEAATESTTASGKVYRVWMDVKSAVSTNERTSILESCEYGEDAWRRAYEEALKSEDLMAEEAELVKAQYDAQKKSHDLIKKYRDAQLALH